LSAVINTRQDSEVVLLLLLSELALGALGIVYEIFYEEEKYKKEKRGV